MNAILQNASLRKGIIFAPDLSEWGQGRDAITGILPANTAVYPILNSRGSGRRWLEYNGVSSYSALPSIPAFGTSDFSVIRRVTVGAIGAIRTLIGGATDSFELYISATGYLTAIKYGGTALTASTALLVAGQTYSLAYVRSGTTGTYFVDGVAAGTTTDASDYTVACTLIGSGTGFFNGADYMVRCFAVALTSQQVINYSKPVYVIESIHRGAGVDLVVNGDFSSTTGWYGWTDTGMSISGGKLNFSSAGNGFGAYKVGIFGYGARYKVTYTISGYTAGAVRIRVGSALYGTSRSANGTYTEIITSLEAASFGGIQATTTTTLSVDDFTVVKLGNMLNLNAEGVSSATWVDKTNTLTATNSGTTFTLPSASNLRAMYFKGSAKLAFSNMDGLTGSLSFAARIRPVGLSGRIFDNSKFFVTVNPSGYLTVSRDGATLINSAAASIAINTDYKIEVLSTSAGVTNIYINGALSGAANQAAGTPASGTTWNIGDNAASGAPFVGIIEGLACWGAIQTSEEIALVNTIL